MPGWVRQVNGVGVGVGGIEVGMGVDVTVAVGGETVTVSVGGISLKEEQATSPRRSAHMITMKVA
jgi:hypothetical protein